MGRVRSVALALVALVALVSAGCEPAGGAGSAAARGGGDGGSWTQFGGPGGEFRGPAAPLADRWPAAGPPELWSRDLGAGYSGVAVAGGTLVTAAAAGGPERPVHRVLALDADDGSTLWSFDRETTLRPQNQVQFGTGPNATPAVHGDLVFSLAYDGALVALELATGRPVWSRDLVLDLGADPLPFGFSASPVAIDGKLVVLVGGGRQAALALDPETGTEIWRSPPGSVSYATPRTIRVGDREQLLYFAADALVALDPADGARLWSVPVENEYGNHASMPIWWAEENLLWVATQADGGTRALRVRLAEDGTTSVEQVWFNGRIRIHFWNAMREGAHVYASIGGQASVLACVDLRDGSIVWKERGFSQANFVRAGDTTVLLDENGELALVDLSPEGLRVVSQTRISDAVSWTAPTLAGTRLYVRDARRIRAFDLGRGASG